jgi:NitT/TauT family transport system substrate-binding protein
MRAISKGLILGLCLLLAACAEKPQEPLRISAVLWPGYEPLYLATKLGYLDDQPVQLIDYLSNTDAMHAFRSHQLEAGAFTFDEALQLLADGMDIQIVLVMDISDGGDVIVANPDIARVEQLKGRRVAVETSAVGAYVLARALELHGLALEDVEVVSTNAMEQLDAFRNGRIDAAVSFDPHRTRLIKQGKREIFNSREMPNEVFDVLVVRRDYSERYPQTVQKVVDAWFRALDYQAGQPRRSAAYSVNRFDTTVDDYIASLSRMKFADREQNRILLDPQHSPLIANAARIYGILARLQLAQRSVRIGRQLHPDYIR